MDFEFADRTWNKNDAERMVFGIHVEDSKASDGFADVPGLSWYQMRCKAYDRGCVDSIHDAIQFEQVVDVIPDNKVRAAVILAMHGWDLADIGAAIGGRRTGSMLVDEGLGLVGKIERRRAELRKGGK
jgi:hypothetical protein